MSCPRCGQDNPPSARFCNACGAPQVQAREERRLVTILFADVAASTELATRIDPESLRALLGRFYDHAREVVAAHGGTLEKYIGDAVMAVFGIPQAHDDDAERAVRAALALGRAVGDDPTLRAQVAIRVGVNTGEVVGALGSTGDFIVTGEPVNIAARLQQNADAGAVLVGDRTARATEGRVTYDGPLTLRVKGKAEPIVAWRALEARELGPRDVRSRTAFLGRDDDVALLRALVRRAFSERRVHVITLLAPAGIGKSRLADELLAGLADTSGAPRIGRALCLPYGNVLAYGAMRGVLRTLAGGMERVPELLASAGLTEGERDAILVAAGLRDDGQRSLPRDEVARAWRDLLAGLARERSLVIFTDDLHFASDSLLALIEDVLRVPLDAPIALVFAARPDLLERRPGWPATRRDVTLIQLRPLPSDDVGRLVTALGGAALPARTRQRIVARADGNPFFAEEMVRAARTEQDTGIMPDSVQAAILARLDQLGERERRVMQAAAVVGRPFTVEELRAVDPGLDSAAVDAALAALAERELIAPLDATRSLFRHGLIRDVALATLPRRELADAHVRLAERLESEADAESAELAAAHLVEAVDLRASLGLPPEEALRARTVRTLTRAADRAFQLYATSLARAHLDRALALATSDEERLALVERSGDVIARETPSETAAQAYRDALALWERVGREGPTGARLHRKLALLMSRWPGAFRVWPSDEEIEREANEAIALAGNDRHERGLALLALAGLRTESRTPVSKRLELLAEAERLLADHPDPDVAGLLGDAQTVALWAGGDYEGLYRRAREIVESSARFGSQERVEALRRLSIASTITWRMPEARAAGAKALEMCEAGELGHTYIHALQTQMYLAAFADDWDEALRLGERLVGEWERQGEKGAACNRAASALMGTVLHRRGEHERARMFDDVLDALRAARSSGRVDLDYWLLRRHWLGDRAFDPRALAREYAMHAQDVTPLDSVTLAETTAIAGDMALAEETLAHASAYRTPPTDALRRRVAGRIALARGDRATAERELRAALEGLHAAGLRWDAACTAMLLAPLASIGERERLRADAREIFAALGDRISLAELDPVKAQADAPSGA